VQRVRVEEPFFASLQKNVAASFEHPLIEV
jgi:hypothetical protein